MSNPQISPADFRNLSVDRGSLTWKKPAKATQKRGTMNRVEADYAAHLELQKRCGAIVEYAFEAITLKLAADCRFTPDFMLQLPDGTIEIHDTKALWKGSSKPRIEDDARVKLRVASRLFPFRVLAVFKDVDGNWQSEEF